MDNQKIELKLTPDHRIICKSAKNEMELVVHKSLKGLCVPNQSELDGARIFSLSDPLWWIGSNGEFVAVDYSRAIA